MNLRLFLTTALLLAGAARAQLATSKLLTLDAARRIAAAAAVEARIDRTSAIAVVDAGGALVYFERLDGTFPAASAVSFDKAHTAATFQRATKDFEDAIHNGRGALTGVKEMTPLQGGVPIVVEGKVIGAVGISGASSAARDEAIARAAVAAVAQLSSEPVKTASVATLTASTVKAGFAKGSVLLDRGDYQVHASRRDDARQGRGPPDRHRRVLRARGHGDVRDRGQGAGPRDHRAARAPWQPHRRRRGSHHRSR